MPDKNGCGSAACARFEFTSVFDLQVIVGLCGQSVGSPIYGRVGVHGDGVLGVIGVTGTATG